MPQSAATPSFLAALATAHIEIIDETVRMFDMALASTDSNASDQLAEREREAARPT